MTKFLVQIAKPDLFFRWVAINADDEDAARATALARFPGYTINKIIADGPA
jgi:hypothetical protein